MCLSLSQSVCLCCERAPCSALYSTLHLSSWSRSVEFFHVFIIFCILCFRTLKSLQGCPLHRNLLVCHLLCLSLMPDPLNNVVASTMTHSVHLMGRLCYHQVCHCCFLLLEGKNDNVYEILYIPTLTAGEAQPPPQKMNVCMNNTQVC